MDNTELNKTIIEQESKVLVNQISINRYAARLYSNEFPNHSSVANGEEGEPIINRKLITFERLKENLNERILKSESPQKGPEFSLMPMNCRLVTPLSHEYTLYVIETAPEIRTITTSVDQNNFISILKSTGEWDEYGYTGMEKPKGEYHASPWSFNLAFPYCVYLIGLSSGGREGKNCLFQIFFRNMPLRGLGDMLYKAPLYNIPDSQNACLGHRTTTERDPLLHIEQLLQHFWGTEYNNDYIDNVQLYQRVPIANNYFIWQHISKTNPMEIFRVDWIPFMTLKKQIEKFKHDYREGRRKNAKLFYTIEDFTSIFSSETIVQQKKINEDEEPRTLIEGVSNYISLGYHTLYIEDSFKIKNKRFFIVSFMSDDEYSYEVSHLKVFDANQNIKIIKLTNKIKSLIIKSIEKDNFILSTSVDGITIKRGDIVKIVTAGGYIRYRKILHMRYNLDGKLEARLGSDNFIVEKLKIAEVMDLDEPKIYGVLVDKEIEYIWLTHLRRMQQGRLLKYNKGKYCDTTVNDSGGMEHVFETIQGNNKHHISPDPGNTENDHKLIYRSDELRRFPFIYRQGIRFVSYNDEHEYNLHSYAIANDATLTPGEDGIQHLPQINDISRSILYNEGQSILIEGLDGDLHFSIGEKVIVPDWSNPLEMLKYKTIKGFNTIEDEDNSSKMEVILENKDASIFSRTLISRSNRPYSVKSWIDLGAMYRVTNIYGELKAGMKIKAKEPRISNFPMKDVNIIIGILTDLGIEESPLVLCSNGCTLWYEDVIEKFNIIEFSDSKWKKLEHVPLIVSKIKPQAGDFYARIYEPKNPYFLCYDTIGNNSLKAVYYQQSAESYEYRASSRTFNVDMKRNAIPYGILGPRYSHSQLIDMPRVSGFASPFLTITESRRSRHRFPINEGRANNYVQRISE